MGLLKDIFSKPVYSGGVLGDTLLEEQEEEKEKEEEE